ncbi:hypothetical protein ACJJTC_006170 [Scirpophaga incertulas]
MLRARRPRDTVSQPARIGPRLPSLLAASGPPRGCASRYRGPRYAGDRQSPALPAAPVMAGTSEIAALAYLLERDGNTSETRCAITEVLRIACARKRVRLPSLRNLNILCPIF